MLLHEELKRFRQIFLGIITSQCLHRDMKLCLNLSTKALK